MRANISQIMFDLGRDLDVSVDAVTFWRNPQRESEIHFAALCYDAGGDDEYHVRTGTTDKPEENEVLYKGLTLADAANVYGNVVTSRVHAG